MSKPHPESRRNKGKFRLEKTSSGARFVLTPETPGTATAADEPSAQAVATAVASRAPLAEASPGEGAVDATSCRAPELDLKVQKTTKSSRKAPARHEIVPVNPAPSAPPDMASPSSRAAEPGTSRVAGPGPAAEAPSAPSSAASEERTASNARTEGGPRPADPRAARNAPAASSYGFRVNAPTIESPLDVAPIVSGGRKQVKASCRVDGREVFRVPQGAAAAPEPERTAEYYADETDTACPEPPDTDIQESREEEPRASSDTARHLGRAAIIILLMGVVAWLFRGTPPAPQPSEPVAGSTPQKNEMARLAPAKHSRLFERGLDGSIQKALAEGYYVAVERNEDGTMSNRLIYEDMMSKDLAAVQELARIKSESLEKPLFIIAGTPPQVVDRVNPEDRVARREYMMLVWSLKQDALHWPRERYLSRDAFDARRTVAIMSRFIGRHPDSRMVASALRDMRHVCYFGLQDPEKFLTVVQSLVHQALANDRARQGAPELARVVGPYLKEAVNQVLYQRIHRMEPPLKPVQGGAEALDLRGGMAPQN